MSILRVEQSNPDYSRANTTTLTIHSSHLKGRHDISVYHHASQQPGDNENKGIPIVILLHGVYGSHWVWMDLGGVHLVYEQLRQQGLSEFILVMPSDGGLWDGSAYLPLITTSEQLEDNFNLGNFNLHNYEQWIVDDVIQATISSIDGASEHSHVYLSGLSMGGYGALRLGAKFPEKFSGISAHSSVTSLNDLQQFIDNPISDYHCANAHESNLAYWFEKNKAALPPLRFDCGRDDSLFNSNIALAKTFDNLAIPYQFDQLSGSHEWPYWHKNVATTLKFFDQIETQSKQK